MNGSLLSRFDVLLFDLDGVVYLGPEPVPHAAETIAAARAAGVLPCFVTNNAARPAQSVVDHLLALGVEATATDVVTSPEAAVALLPGFVEPGARVLVIGGAGIDAALVDAGYEPVRGLADGPAAVMQGYSPDLSWRDLAEASYAVRSGLPWIATNPDLTFPTPRGVAPGNGALVQVVAQTVGRQPDAVAGKPAPPLLTEAIRRTHASSPLMIGDRLDTDILAGSVVGVSTLLVMTGVTTIAELVAAVPNQRPSFVGADLRVLVDPYPVVAVDASALAASSSEAHVRVDAGRMRVLAVDADPWNAVRAAAALAWHCADAGVLVDVGDAVAAMGRACAEVAAGDRAASNVAATGKEGS